MPSGQSSTQTTQVQAPIAVNQPLQQLFTSLFGGNNGLATGASNTLMGIMNGSTLGSNIGQLYKTLSTNSSVQYQQGLGAIKAAEGASGMRFSTDTSSQIGSYTQNYIQQLNNTATQMGLQELGVQEGAATNTLGIFSQAANQYYSPGQTTTGKTQQTGLGSWIDSGLGIAGGAIGLGMGLQDLGGISGIGQLFQ